MVKIYWNGEGKYEKELKVLDDLIPRWGMTDNKYMNLFIVASAVYSDIYNNGGGNLKDSYTNKIEKYLIPFAGEVKTIRLNSKIETIIKNLKNEEKLERFMDEIILYLQDKDLTYDKQTIFFNNETEELSEQEVKGFNIITFGNRLDCEKWVNNRKNNGFKMITG